MSKLRRERRATLVRPVPVAEAELPLIDDEAMRNWCEDLDADDIASVLARVPAESLNSLAEIRRAIALSDLALARRMAHRLKGMAGNLGAARLAQICRSIEVDCTDIADVAAALPALQCAVADTLAAIAALH